MIYQREVSSKAGCQKTDNSSGKKKSRIPGNGQKKSKPGPSSSSQYTTSASGASDISKATKDPQLTLKLLELAPRNPGKETSKGVQDFINHVSKLLEKKNPFKEKPMEYRVRKNAVQSSVTSLKNNKNVTGTKQGNAEVKNSEGRVKKEQKLLPRSLLNSPDNKKRKAVVPNGKKEAGKEVEREKTMVKDNETKLRQKSFTEQKKDSEHKVSSGECLEKPEPLIRQVKRIRPSEIPLRKDRPDLLRKIKPVSYLMQKTLKEAEITASIDFYQKKAFSPIKELRGIASDVQSDEKTPKSAITDPVKNIKMATNDNVELNRCSKNVNIPLASDLSSCELSKKPSGTKSRMLDLQKVKSSSFTVLGSNISTLSRLETYHQQNISAKESGVVDELVTSNSSKLKILTSKTSFNSLKKKGSKKNLSARLSSKGNKPTLKNKAKKVKKNYEHSINTQCRKKPDASFDSILKQIPDTEEVESQQDRVDRSSDGGRVEVRSTSLRKSNFSVVKSTGEQCIMHSAQGEGERRSQNLEILANAIERQIIPEEVQMNPSTPPATPQDEPKPEENSKVNETSDQPTKPLTPVIKTVEIPKEHKPLECTMENRKKKPSTVKPTKKPMVPNIKVVLKEKSNQSLLDLKIEDLVLRGTALKFTRDEGENKEQVEQEKVKLQIKIDINEEEVTVNREKSEPVEDSAPSFDSLYLNCHEEYCDRRNSLNGREELNIRVEEKIEEQAELDDKTKVEDRDTTLRSLRSSSSLKTDIATVNLTEIPRKKMRSDAGDRWLCPSTEPFNSSITFQTKIKPDTKLRSGLTKSSTRESKVSNEKRDFLDDAAAVKLRRRNSEPNSFRGFIWKRADLAVPKSKKASVSSMTSSLKHLNTDDLEDFIFWEALPQKMTSCWEMSLYHFKRPWSVLSCSIFKDNRESSTPGLILQNLRNGRAVIDRQLQPVENERIFLKANPFDVEPSIAQKNIDIRNWLAALNFPTLPSTSSDAISEGNFCSQPLAAIQNINKNQMNPKRRKVLPGLKFSNEIVETKPEDKKRYKDSSRELHPNEVGSLIELIRRKSGDFVTAEQFLNPEIYSPPPITFNFSTYSKSDKENAFEVISNVKEPVEPEITEIEDTTEPIEKYEAEEEQEPERSQPGGCFGALTKAFTGEEVATSSSFNLWKYIFILTLSTIMLYFFLVEKACSSAS